MNYFEESYATISYNEASRIVTVEFKGYVNSDQLRDLYQKAVECSAKYRCSKNLVDSRKYITMKPEDQKWMVDVLYPKAFNAGVRKVAILMPENVIQKQVAEKTMSSNKTTIAAKMFSSLSEATAWLKL